MDAKGEPLQGRNFQETVSLNPYGRGAKFGGGVSGLVATSWWIRSVHVCSATGLANFVIVCLSGRYVKKL
jgi:hypothetical protein